MKLRFKGLMGIRIKLPVPARDNPHCGQSTLEITPSLPHQVLRGSIGPLVAISNHRISSWQAGCGHVTINRNFY